MDKIRWGIIGPGNIAKKFTEDLCRTQGALPTAVASRKHDRASQFANTFNIERVFSSYEDLFHSNEVDVVYIATPHVFHYQLAIDAMKHGKHVLCEKPLGVNHDQVSKMVQVAREQNVFLMEGLWSRFNPSIIQIKSMIDQGQLGTLRYLNADFAFNALDRPKECRLFNPALAGGSLLDIGIYPVFLAYLILGIPQRITAQATLDANGLETQIAMNFKYQAAHALLYSGLTHNSRMCAEIAGENGSVFIDPRWHEPNGFTLEINGEKKHIASPKLGNGFVYEIEEVHKCVLSKKLESPLWSHQNSLDLISILDTLRAQTGITFPFEKQ